MNIVDRDKYWEIQENLGSITISTFIAVNFPRHKKFVHNAIKKHFMYEYGNGKFRPKAEFLHFFKRRGTSSVWGIRIDTQRDFIQTFTVSILDEILNAG